MHFTFLANKNIIKKMEEKIWEIQEGVTCPYLKGTNLPEGMKNILKDYDIMKGIGTQSNPYQIKTANQLSSINYQLDAAYILVDNIDLRSINNWTPIGTDSAKCFKGTFNGNGHTISNMKITNRSEDNTGLFGYVGANVTINNVRLENYTITCSGSNVGGLIGYADHTIVNNTSTSGTITSSTGSYIGGLIGKVNYVTVENSYSEGRVIARNGSCVAGLFGGTEARTGNSTIKNVYSTAQVEGNEYVGGIAGRLYGSVDNGYIIGKVQGNSRVGALFGYKGCSVTSCYWNTETTGISGGYTTEQMKSQSNYANWDFDTIWIMGDDGYPKLRGNN